MEKINKPKKYGYKHLPTFCFGFLVKCVTIDERNKIMNSTEMRAVHNKFNDIVLKTGISLQFFKHPK